MRTSIAPLILGVLILLVAAENPAHQRDKRAVSDRTGAAMEKIVEKGMVFAGGVIEKLKNSDVARKLIGKVLGTMSGQRAKRSINVEAAVTNYKVAQYQKLVVHQAQANGGTEACPIGQNELNWIETVSIAVQQALSAMNKVINGQKVGYNIRKPTGNGV